MKRMTRETFEYILSKLTKGDTWTVQTLTEHGVAGGGYQLCRNEHDGLLICNGFIPLPKDDGSNDSLMWDYFTQVLKRWPRSSFPSFAYTPEQQQRAKKRQAIRHARKGIERNDKQKDRETVEKELGDIMGEFIFSSLHGKNVTGMVTESLAKTYSLTKEQMCVLKLVLHNLYMERRSYAQLPTKVVETAFNLVIVTILDDWNGLEELLNDKNQ